MWRVNDLYICNDNIICMYINQNAKDIKNFYAYETNKLLNFSILFILNPPRLKHKGFNIVRLSNIE